MFKSPLGHVKFPIGSYFRACGDVVRGTGWRLRRATGGFLASSFQNPAAEAVISLLSG
jgi:hypothetical protein